MKSLAAINYLFRLLFNVVRLVLIMPHSNAGIERVYALVNKNKAEGTDRNRLDIKESLSSILTVKLARPEAFFKCYDDKLLDDAKNATTKYNTSHSSISSNVATLPKALFFNFILTEDGYV